MGFAKPTSTVTAAPKKAAKGKDRPELTVAKMEKMASLAALIEALQTRYATLDADVRSEAFDYVVNDAVATGRQCDNPDLVEGIGSANYQLKARSSAYALKDDDFAALQEAGFAVEDKVLVPAYLAVNPKYAANQDLLEKADALLSAGGIPDDFVVEIAAVTRKLPGDKCVTQILATKNEEKIREFLPLVTTPAISRIKVSDFDKALALVTPEIQALYNTKNTAHDQLLADLKASVAQLKVA